MMEFRPGWVFEEGQVSPQLLRRMSARYRKTPPEVFRHMIDLTSPRHFVDFWRILHSQENATNMGYAILTDSL